MSPSVCVQYGPARMRERSRMRTPLRAPRGAAVPSPEADAEAGAAALEEKHLEQSTTHERVRYVGELPARTAAGAALWRVATVLQPSLLPTDRTARRNTNATPRADEDEATKRSDDSMLSTDRRGAGGSRNERTRSLDRGLSTFAASTHHRGRRKRKDFKRRRSLGERWATMRGRAAQQRAHALRCRTSSSS